MSRLSIRSAILWGLLCVNGPVYPLMFGVPALALFATDSYSWNLPSFFICLSVPLGFLLAWLWWSLTLPKWRLWALKRVDDFPHLYDRAVRVQLMWPRGHFFEKTEIKSASHAVQELEIELVYFLTNYQEELNVMSKEVGTAAQVLQESLINPSDFVQRMEAAIKLQETMISFLNLSGYDSTTGYSVNHLVWWLTEYVKWLKKGNGS